ncbi:MAG: RpoL/Rpb11 RNA polymerase subunit family protein [Candidatus Nanohaloarchaea archaeon]
MELEAVEKDGRMIIDVRQNHTIANLVRKAVWENGGEAAYDKGHPLGGESSLIVESEEPKEVLKDAVETAREWMEEVEAQL